MIRLTVLLDQAPLEDFRQTLSDRASEESKPLLRCDGAVRAGLWQVDTAWPQGELAPYRYIATFDWANWESFEQGLARRIPERALKRAFGRLGGPVYLVSELGGSPGQEGGGA